MSGRCSFGKQFLRRTLLLALMLPTLFLAGCLKSQTLDESEYVLAIAFDPGETFTYRFSFAVQRINTEASEPRADGFFILSAEAETLFAAIETVSASLSHELSFARTTMMIFDASLLERDGCLADLLDSAMEQLLIRYNANVYVSVDGALEALEGLSGEDAQPGIDKLQSHFLDYASETGFLPRTNLMQLYETMSGRCVDAALPLIGTTEGLVRLGVADSVGGEAYAYLAGRMLTQTGLQTGVAGAALLRDDRMVGVLDGQNVQLLLLVAGGFENGGMQFSLPESTGGELYAAVRQDGAARVELILGETPRATVALKLYLHAMHPEMLPDGVTVEALERRIESELAGRLQSLFDTCRSLGSDVFGFGRYAVRQFQSVADWEAYDWADVYYNMEATFTVDVVLDANEYHALLK